MQVTILPNSNSIAQSWYMPNLAGIPEKKRRRLRKQDKKYASTRSRIPIIQVKCSVRRQNLKDAAHAARAGPPLSKYEGCRCACGGRLEQVEAVCLHLGLDRGKE